MPIPLKPNEHFYIEHKLLPSNFTMPTMMVALDHYSLSYIIQGDRKTLTPTHIYTYHSGDITLAPPLNYGRTTSLSTLPYERILIKFSKEMIAPLIDTIGSPMFEANMFFILLLLCKLSFLICFPKCWRNTKLPPLIQNLFYKACSTDCFLLCFVLN